MCRISSTILCLLIISILLLNIEGSSAGNGTYADCICVESNSSTPKFQISIISVENESTRHEEIANSNELDSISDAREKFEEGVKYSERRDKKAINSYLKAINIDEEHGEIWYNLGNAYYYENNFTGALDAYQNAIKWFPEDDNESRSWVSFNMGNSYYMLGNFEAAEKYYNYAIANISNYTDAYNNRALAKIEVPNYSGALNDTQLALSILYPNERSTPIDKSQAVRVWNNMGRVLSHLKRYDEALSALENATEIEDNPYSYFYQGLIVADLDQQLQESLDLLNKSLGFGNGSLSDRDRFVVNSSMGNVYLKFQKYSNAVSAFNESLSIEHKRGPSWNNTSAWIGKGTALMHLKDRNLDALASFNQALKQDPTNIEANYGKGDVLYELGCYDDAIKAYQQGLMRDKLDRVNSRFDIQEIFLYIISALTVVLASILIFSSNGRNTRYYIVFPSALVLQSLSFFFIMMTYFPLKVSVFYIYFAIAILVTTYFFWRLGRHNGLDIWLKFKEDLDNIISNSRWAEQMNRLIALLILILIGFAPVFITWGEEYNNYLNVIANKLLIIMILGFLLIYIPLWIVLISDKTDDKLRKEALLIIFCWLGLNSLYLSRLLWCKGWIELNSPRNMGLVTIPKETPIMPISIVLAFIIFFLIPYIYGWHRSKQKQEEILTERLNDLNTLITILQLKEMRKETPEKIYNINKKIFGNTHPESSSKDVSRRTDSQLAEKASETQDRSIKSLSKSSEVSTSSIKSEIFDRVEKVNLKGPSNDLETLYKYCIDETQKKLDSRKASKPQLWIAAVSLLSPLIIQILSSMAIQMGLSSKPESLFSGLSQILAGI